MILQTFLQDLRVGARVLIKEKTFCFLAVTVLALGICGVATMYSVVNGTMLRGFPFPMPPGWPVSRSSTSPSEMRTPTALAGRFSRSISKR